MKDQSGGDFMRSFGPSSYPRAGSAIPKLFLTDIFYPVFENI